MSASIERITEQRLPSQATKGEIELAALKAAGFERVDPATRAIAVEVANRYGLELMLKHLVAIDGKFYITRDGLLHVAHRSGQLDGIVVEEVGADGEAGWFAIVSVYRKGMSHPFRFRGRYNGPNKRFGPEMAVKCAEVMGLRRAFDVALAAEDEVADSDSTARPAGAALPWKLTADAYLAMKNTIGAKKIPKEDVEAITANAMGGREVLKNSEGVPILIESEFKAITAAVNAWKPPPAAPTPTPPVRDLGVEAPVTVPVNPHWVAIQKIAADSRLQQPLAEAVKLATKKSKPSELTADDVKQFEMWLRGGDDDFALDGGR